VRLIAESCRGVAKPAVALDVTSSQRLTPPKGADEDGAADLEPFTELGRVRRWKDVTPPSPDAPRR
jgi:hypothetical protein